MSKKALKIINIFVVLYLLVGQLVGAIIFYSSGSTAVGHASLFLFVIFALVYWQYGLDYFEVDIFKRKNKSKEE